MKNLRFWCLAIALAPMVASDLALGASPCLVIFIGGWKDHKTMLMKDLRDDYKDIFNCKTTYHGYDDQNQIAEDIRRFRSAHDREHVIVVGHSLGGSTALTFADNGANYVVTLDAYYPMSLIGSIAYLDISSRTLLWVIGLFTPKRKFGETYWTYVETEKRRSCGNAKKIGLSLAEFSGSGPIDKNDVTLRVKPDDYVYCKNCDHCDVKRMFEQALPKLRDRL